MQQRSWWVWGGRLVMLKVSRQSEVTLHACVTSKWWLLKARWAAVINLDLIDSFSMVENTPQPEWAQHARSFWCSEIVLEAIECRRLEINLTIRIMCWVYDITSVGPTLVLINCKWKRTCNPVNSKIQSVSVYSSCCEWGGSSRGGATQSHVLCVNEHSKD